MTRLLTIFLLVGTCSLFAQQKVQEVKINNISPLNKMSFYCDKVIDARSQTENIGYVLRAINKKKAVVKFEKSFLPTMEYAFNKLLTKKTGLTPVVAIVHHLEITEHLSYQQKTPPISIFVAVEFAKDIDGELSTLGQYEYTLLLQSKFLLGENLLQVLSECIRAFDADNVFGEFNLQLDEEQTIYDFHSAPERGIYRSFGQLARGKAIDVNPFDIRKETTSKKYPEYRLYYKNKLIKEEISYCSDGEHLYISLDNGFGRSCLQSKFIGKYIYFDLYSLTFLNIGILISFKNPSNLILDTTSGKLYILDRYNIHQLIGEYPDLMAQFHQSKKKIRDIEAVIRLLNKKFEGKKI